MDQFNKVANIYAESRPVYPAVVFQKIRQYCAKDKLEVVVDLACGSGQSLEGLNTFSKKLFGIEPGKNLREEAKKKYPYVDILDGSGEKIPMPENSTDLITIANAFYWMDRNIALGEISRVLKPAGSLVLYRYLFPRLENIDANTFLNDQCSKFWDTYRDERLTKKDDSAEIILETGYFSELKKEVVPYIWEISVSNFVSFLSSTSYFSKYLESLSENSKKEYSAYFAKEINQAYPSGLVPVILDIHMIFTCKI